MVRDTVKFQATKAKALEAFWKVVLEAYPDFQPDALNHGKTYRTEMEDRAFTVMWAMLKWTK